jgi:beta-glucanase (GH16 family)
MLDAHIRTTNGVHRVAAFTPKFASGSSNQLYGRYAVRFKVDSMRGYKGAWLLWPQSETWPRDGEIDFPEGDFDRTIEAYMHRQGATSGSDQDAFQSGKPWTTWHTAVTEWTPNAVRFYLDGTLIGTSTSRIPNTPMRWVIQNETTLSGFVPADSVSGHVLIDWVAVWSYAP